VGTTDGVTWYRNFARLPWDDPGVNDLRTPISQREEFYQALKVRKVPRSVRQ
jgi:hypothetical protein